MTLSADDTVALCGDGDLVLGKLLKVESDGIAAVQVEGGMTLPAGSGASVTVGRRIVGDLGADSARGYIQELADASAGSGAEINAAEIPLGLSLYEEAYKRGMSASAYLETIDPSEQYKDGMDAFERQLYLADVRTRSDPVLGLYAHPVSRFYESERKGAEALLPEFIVRTWRKAALGGLERFYASSEPLSDVLYPAYIQTVARAKQIAPAIPLSLLLAITTPIDSGVYQAFYLTDDTDERTMRRVAEGAEVPTARLTGGDHSIVVKKYGRRLLGSYETFRRMRIDRFALHIALLAVKAESDKVDTAIDVLVNGDGNSGTSAVNYSLTALDTGAVAGTLTLKGYLRWRMQFANPYVCNVVLAQEADALQVLLLNMGSANVPYFVVAGASGQPGVGGISLINPTLGGGVGLGWTSGAPANKLLGIDNRFALEQVIEIGASITETDKIIRQQLNEIVMTESLAFCVFDPNANKTLTINA